MQVNRHHTVTKPTLSILFAELDDALSDASTLDHSQQQDLEYRLKLLRAALAITPRGRPTRTSEQAHPVAQLF